MRVPVRMPLTYQQRKARVATLVASVLLTFSSLLLGISVQDKSVTAILLGGNWVGQIGLLISFLGLIVGSGMLLLMYLRGDLKLRFLDSVFSMMSSFVTIGIDASDDETLHELRRAIEEVKKAQVSASSGGRDDVIATLLPLVQSGIGEELEKKFARQSQHFESLNQIRKIFADSGTRLRLELASLRNRGNLNLVIGTLTTAIAIVLLTYMVLGSTRTFADTTDLLAYYVPRVTIVVFIEVFAFFFLKLYRDTLAEMRAYQGELTRLNIQQVAVEAVWTDEVLASRKALAETLIQATRIADVPPAKDDVDLKTVTSLIEKLSKLLPSRDAIAKP